MGQEGLGRMGICVIFSLSHLGSFTYFHLHCRTSNSIVKKNNASSQYVEGTAGFREYVYLSKRQSLFILFVLSFSPTSLLLIHGF